MTGDTTDAALVVAARSGSDAAFARLVGRHQQAVRRFLGRVCLNDADAEDVAQDAFLSAWTKLRELRDPALFRSWLFGMAWRKAKTAARGAVRGRERDTAWQADRPQDTTPETEMNLALQQAMTQLPDDQRAAVALCLGAGWSHGDAAGILEMPLGTVKSHVTRGRARLEQILGVRDER